MVFKFGETVVYPHHGAALIEAIETRTIKGEERKYLVLKVAQGDLTVRVPAETAEEQSRIVQSVRRGENIPPYETERVRKDGTRIQVSLTVSPIRDSTGRVVGASRIARDITRRKQMEQIARCARRP